ncbi:MAG TPA: dTDP-4-dehydrorhamnose reductase [Candidatus Krumholzibacteria bacterium]|nr:dTDP-4-dehydrorhamnose reductase [Candidatus Krumholzibacteria bacterium]HPD72730.1 dTDP-4-dehydrorhamnose reductase [Candidatus Krumholzibacteria bacterium]HRY40338.1 dTDP-4-dehydrorhamnose reductase [Candidatus Krumholzibacteria bacterium]
MRILVTGVRGQLGRACRDAFSSAGHPTAGVDLPEGDLAEPDTAPRLIAEYRPDRVVHCAAYTAVDRAEEERDLALAANTTATENLAAACAETGCAITYLSTDYVFPGSAADGYGEADPRRPVNWYGETKAGGEVAVEVLSVPWQIVRTSWLFGHGPVNFVRTIRRLLAERPTVAVVDDQRGCPTYAPDLAGLLVRLAEAGARGVFHGTNAGVCTWFAFAREIARLGGADPERICPCTTRDYPTPARRPACSILRDTRLAALGVGRLRDWRQALAEYLDWLDRNEETAIP